MLVTEEITSLLLSIVPLLEETCDLKEQEDVVSRSSTEIEYRAMTHTTYEMVWLKKSTDGAWF